MDIVPNKSFSFSLSISLSHHLTIQTFACPQTVSARHLDPRQGIQLFLSSLYSLPLRNPIPIRCTPHKHEPRPRRQMNSQAWRRQQWTSESLLMAQAGRHTSRQPCRRPAASLETARGRPGWNGRWRERGREGKRARFGNETKDKGREQKRGQQKVKRGDDGTSQGGGGGCRCTERLRTR